MTRRMIDSRMWSDERFKSMPAMARLLQIGMINHADDQGRIKAGPAYLYGLLFLDDDVTTEQIQSWLGYMEVNDTIVLYKVAGRQYAQFVNWWQYQTLQFARPSQLPRPAGWLDCIRFNDKGNRMLVCNWTTPSGSRMADTCDQEGKPFPFTMELPAKKLGTDVPAEAASEVRDEAATEVPTEARTLVPADVGTQAGTEVGTQVPGEVTINLTQLNLREEAAAARARVSEPEIPQRIREKWEANMPGMLTPLLVKQIAEELTRYSAAEFERAIEIAVEKEQRKLSYVRGCLKKDVFSNYAPARPNGSGDSRRNYDNATSRMPGSTGSEPDAYDPELQRQFDEHRAKRKAEGSLYYQ